LRHIKQAVVLLLVLAMILPMGVSTLASEEPVLIILGDGVEQEMSFTRTELTAMTAHISLNAYSAWNTWPTRSVHHAEGVALAELLRLAGLKNNATTINVAEAPQAQGVPGYNMTFLLDDLLDVRYTFEGGRRQVPAIIAFRQGRSFAEMEDTPLRLIFGQLTEQEQTTMGFVRSTRYITVTTDPIRQVPVPEATAQRRSDGRYDITLTSINANAKIHYTTDGSVPTVSSTMFNISAPHWQPHLNVPFTVSGDTEIRAIAVATGFANSEVLRFTPSTIENGNEPPSEDLDNPGMENFVRTGSYQRGQFTDVNEDLWFGYNRDRVIAKAFEYGLMRGTSATTFNPTGNVTIAEAIAIAARVHSIYTTGTASFTQSSPWHQVYVDYAIANRIISAGDFTNVGRGATRAEMAYIFANALPQNEFQRQNTVNSLPDVGSATPFRASIILLFEAGVLTGNDAAGTFLPNNNISRAEASAIISRVILPETRATGGVF